LEREMILLMSSTSVSSQVVHKWPVAGRPKAGAKPEYPIIHQSIKPLSQCGSRFTFGDDLNEKDPRIPRFPRPQWTAAAAHLLCRPQFITSSPSQWYFTQMFDLSSTSSTLSFSAGDQL
jgi:hypothetical protein